MAATAILAMTLVGRRLGPYEITAKLGEGGMGEVYRATDTKLRRDVAIKVLPAAFTEDKERLGRFEREAQLLAQLHHPNIASIFGLEESAGVRALVMELVEGDDLSTLIARGPLPVPEALAIARQIAEALEAAHDHGIVHRDLKPANVKVRGDGTVKVLDFGLAKALDTSGIASSHGVPAGPPDSLRSPALMNSPTLTGAHGTQLGMILGTAAYMAPEQARGKQVDRRADIWAFGVVLYEMLAGRRLFAGDEASDVLAAVIRQEVDLQALPAEVPARIRRLLARCLDRDPKTRLRDIGEARLLLSGVEQIEPAETAAIAATPARRPRWLWLALPLVAAVAAAIAWRAKPAAPAPTMRLSIALPAGEQVTTAPAISPDGQTIAYAAGRSAATSRLYLRGINGFESRPVDSGAGAIWPFFSPDGRSVAFFAGGKLRRAPVAGGAARNLAAAPRPFGGTWAADGTILYVPLLNSGVWRVGGEGGQPEQLSEPDDGDNGYAHVFPQALPGGDILFTFWGKTFKTARLTPGAKGWQPVTFDAASGRIATFADAGYLLRGDASGGLLAAPWTPAATDRVEPETVVLENVFWVAGTDRSWVSTAANGTVVYVPGNPGRRRLVWVDRQGVVEELPGEPDLLNSATLSRDGRRVAHNGRNAVWVQDVASAARVRLLTDITWAFLGGWLPGDQSVVVSNNRTGNWDIFAVPPGGGDLRPLVQRPRTQHPIAVAPDGSIVFSDYGQATETGLDLWVRSPGGEVSELVTSPFQDSQASVSADGRYVAYVSDEAGRSDVYAIPFAGGGQRVMVSVDGGTGPMWSRDGRELFYRAGDDLVSVDVLSTEPLALGARRKLLDVSTFEPQYFREFDVAPDGQRFLFIRAEPQSRPTRLDVIVNWFPELTAKVPAK